MRSQVQAPEIEMLRRIEGVMLFGKVRSSSEIKKCLNIIERSQLKMVWPCTQNTSRKAFQTSFTCESKREKTGGTTTNTLGRLH